MKKILLAIASVLLLASLGFASEPTVQNKWVTGDYIENYSVVSNTTKGTTTTVRRLVPKVYHIRVWNPATKSFIEYAR